MVIQLFFFCNEDVDGRLSVTGYSSSFFLAGGNKNPKPRRFGHQLAKQRVYVPGAFFPGGSFSRVGLATLDRAMSGSREKHCRFGTDLI